jgi:hypothetical protein
MAFDLSFGSLSSARERLTRLREGAADSQVTRVANVGVTAASAFGFAWLETRFKNKHPTLVAPMGVPVSAIIGTAALAAAALDFGFGYEDYLASISSGAFAFVASSYGANWGASAAAKEAAALQTAAAQTAAAKTAAAKTEGVLPAPAFHISAQDMAAMNARRAY